MMWIILISLILLEIIGLWFATWLESEKILRCIANYDGFPSLNDYNFCPYEIVDMKTGEVIGYWAEDWEAINKPKPQIQKR